MLGIIIILFFASLSLTVHCLAEHCTEIYCASEYRKSAECEVEDEIKRLEVSKQISSSPCTRNETFDYIGNKVRVEKGCRANFTVCFVKHDDLEPDEPEPDKPKPDNPEPDKPEPDDPEPDDPELGDIKDEPSSNIALYVSVPVAIVVLAVMIVTIVLICRHKHKRKTEEKKYHDQTANNALSNKAYNTQTNDRNQISKYVEQEDAVTEIAEYNYIQDDNVQQDTEEYASCSSHYEITDESNENNMHYNHLSPQVSPVFKANYSELCLNPNNTEITISDNTYSHLPADDDKTDTKRAETIDNTYNKLEFNTLTPTNMIKQTHGCNTEIEDSEYCHANAGGKDRKPVCGNYSHLAQNKIALTRVTPFRRGVAADGYEQPISIGKHLYVDLEQGHQDVSPHCSVVEMRDDNNSGIGTNDEGPGHEYFVLEKMASSWTQ